MDAKCRIELLGRLRVQEGDRVIARFRTQKTAALLGYLAYHCQRPHPREVVMELLWPQCAPAAGRNSLRVALSSLRRQMEGPGVPAGAIIKADRFSVQLNPSAVITDVAEFQAACRAADETESQAEQIELLAEAVDLYGGELLPGYYQDWVLTEQRRLADRYYQAVRRLTHRLKQEGQWVRAIDYARRAVAVGPLREEGHRDLMRLLAAGQQPAAAMDQFRELERILEEELGAAPSAETCRLARQIQSAPKAGDSAHSDLPSADARPAMDVAHTLPAGTVTFLLTEIEWPAGSRQGAGPAFQEAARAHDDLLRRSFVRHGGREVRQSDGAFTVAFARPSDALACAVTCQRELAPRSKREGPDPPKVRMALDTTEVGLRQGPGPGRLLRRATGLLLAGHGGQILCSETSAALLRRRLESGRQSEVQLAELGYYRLRTTQTPERLFELEYAGREPQAFPPPNATPAYTSNLPLQLTAFFGRVAELVRLEEMVLADQTRLVTLTGVGGSGKTRLAVEAGRHLFDAFRGAVWFVPLQNLTEPGQIAEAVADAQRLPRSPHAKPLAQAVEALARQPSLLLLDNFEHLVDEGALVVQTLLEQVPTLTCLVTSRRCLGLTAEREFFVAPLPTPSGDEAPEALMRWASVELFVGRAQLSRPDFQVTEGNAAAVAELCCRLEGIPLALELAAARAQVLTPAQMVEQLDNRFDFLVSRKRDVQRRHRTLRAAMEWSYRLLSADLQRLFAGLSVFRGGWTAEAAEAVCNQPRALDCLEQLRQCSLILAEERPSGAAQMRFRMLETLREYAREQLSAEEHDALRRRHAEYCLALAERAYPELDRLETEHENLRAALQWCKSAEDGAQTGLHLATAVAQFWAIRGYWSEGRAHLTELLARKEAAGATKLRANALRQLAWIAMEQYDAATARALYEERLAIVRELGDKNAVAHTLSALGTVFIHEGDYAEALAAFKESLGIDEPFDYATGVAKTWNMNVGLALLGLGQYAAARAVMERSLEFFRKEGDGNLVAKCLLNLGCTAAAAGDRAAALPLYEEGLALGREVGQKWVISETLLRLAQVPEERGDDAAAQRLYEESLAIRQQMGDEPAIAAIHHKLGELAESRGDYAAARVLYEQSLAARLRSGDQRCIAHCLEGFARICQAEARPERAARLFGAAQALRQAVGVPKPPRDPIGDPLPPDPPDSHDRDVDALRAALGEEAFAAAWSAGRAMTSQQAVAEALSEGER